jgi:hypothetical protein
MGVNNSGIRHIDILFWANLQNCTARVHIARAPAAAQWLTKSIVGEWAGSLVEVKSMDARHETCEIIDGNFFAGSN